MDERPGDVLAIEELAAYLKIPKSILCKRVREGAIDHRLGATRVNEPGLRGDQSKEWRFLHG